MIARSGQLEPRGATIAKAMRRIAWSAMRGIGKESEGSRKKARKREGCRQGDDGGRKHE